MDPKNELFDFVPAAKKAAGAGSGPRSWPINSLSNVRSSLDIASMTPDQRQGYLAQVLSGSPRQFVHTMIQALDHLLEKRLLVLQDEVGPHAVVLSYVSLADITPEMAYALFELLDEWIYHAQTYKNKRLARGRFVIMPASRFTKEKEDTMLEQMLKLYTMFMATGVTSPLPHFVGPPGTGKSTVVKQLADLVGVRLHTVNVSRISPLELEGVQMPDREHQVLNLLHSPLWTQLQDGDIVLLDEFLRGFAEVYNGLLDILTAREVAGLKLKKVFFIAASNSVVTYDGALEDRLLHIHVPDPRHNKAEKSRLAFLLIDALGLNPEVKSLPEMKQLLEQVVMPAYDLLDSFATGGKKSSAKVSQTPGASPRNGASVRKLIGQAQLRHVQEPLLAQLIETSNMLSMKPGKHQFMVLMSGKNVPAGYEQHARNLSGNPKLSAVQALNLELNLQLIEMEKAKSTNNEEYDSDLFIS